VDVSRTSILQALSGLVPVHRSHRISSQPFSQHVRHASRIDGVTTHPASERVVISDERWIIAAPLEPRGLHVRAHIEQAHGNAMQIGR
jgi:hypothetical protein